MKTRNAFICGIVLCLSINIIPMYAVNPTHAEETTPQNRGK